MGGSELHDTADLVGGIRKNYNLRQGACSAAVVGIAVQIFRTGCTMFTADDCLQLVKKFRFHWRMNERLRLDRE